MNEHKENGRHAALGAQFYGIGDEHARAEAYYRAANPAAVLELIAEVERLRADRETAVKEAWRANSELSALKGTAPASGTEKDAELELIGDALDIAYDLAVAEANHVHEVYKGYKPHRHEAVDRDVETIKRAIAAIAAHSKAGKEPQ